MKLAEYPTRAYSEVYKWRKIIWKLGFRSSEWDWGWNMKWDESWRKSRVLGLGGKNGEKESRSGIAWTPLEFPQKIRSQSVVLPLFSAEFQRQIWHPKISYWIRWKAIKSKELRHLQRTFELSITTKISPGKRDSRLQHELSSLPIRR